MFILLAICEACEAPTQEPKRHGNQVKCRSELPRATEPAICSAEASASFRTLNRSFGGIPFRVPQDQVSSYVAPLWLYTSPADCTRKKSTSRAGPERTCEGLQAQSPPTSARSSKGMAAKAIGIKVMQSAKVRGPSTHGPHAPRSRCGSAAPRGSMGPKIDRLNQSHRFTKLSDQEDT